MYLYVFKEHDDFEDFEFSYFLQHKRSYTQEQMDDKIAAIGFQFGLGTPNIHHIIRRLQEQGFVLAPQITI